MSDLAGPPVRLPAGRWRGPWRTPPSAAGALLAAAAYLASLRPSLLPRTTVLQAAVSALAVAACYGLGAAGGALTRQVVRRPPRRVRTVVLAAAVALLAVGVALTPSRLSWQADQSAAIGAGGTGPAWIPVVLLTGLLSVLLVLSGRGLRAAARALGRVWERVVRRAPWPGLLGGLSVAAVLGLLLAAGYAALALAFDRIDASTAGQSPPASPVRSGGPGSLVPWDSLGREGRAYVSGGPTPAQIARVVGRATAPEPIRVFAGLESAPDASARADLAVAELERTGGFERSAVAVITTTGNGFIDPVAADSLELVLGGDVASAGIQYSTLPSWLSFLVDQQASQDAGVALYQAVRARIAALPAADRPALVVYGESLGAFGSLAAFDGLTPAEVAAEVSAGLWVGPPDASSTWRQWTAARDAGPVWQPVVDGGTTVRFATGATSVREQTAAGTSWGPRRLLVVQHATDPVVWWSPRLVAVPPQWLADPRGPGVPQQVRWWPWLLFEQVLMDLPAAGAAPPGAGHDYADSVPLAWVAVLRPPGWDAAATARLLAAVG